MIDNHQSRDTAAGSTPRKFTGVMLGLVQTHRVAILGALLASFLFLAGWLLFRRVPHVPAIVGEWAREAQETAASWPVAPINTASGREEASRYLASRLPVEATSSYPKNVLESGAEFIVEFLAAKQLETFDEYIAWAQSQDYRIRDQWPESPRFKEEVFQDSYRRSLNIKDKKCQMYAGRILPRYLQAQPHRKQRRVRSRRYIHRRKRCAHPDRHVYASRGHV